MEPRPLPLDPQQVDADGDGEQPLLLRLTHEEELLAGELLHRLVLQVLEGVSVVGLVHVLVGGGRSPRGHQGVTKRSVKRQK